MHIFTLILFPHEKATNHSPSCVHSEIRCRSCGFQICLWEDKLCCNHQKRKKGQESFQNTVLVIIIGELVMEDASDRSDLGKFDYGSGRTSWKNDDFISGGDICRFIIVGLNELFLRNLTNLQLKNQSQHLESGHSLSSLL